MKTRMNINRIARMSFASFSMLVVASVGAINAGDRENKAVIDRLEDLSQMVEVSLKYNAPLVDEDIAAFDVTSAFERLESSTLAVEESLKFKASFVNEEAESHDLTMAAERLEDTSLAVEQSLKFIAPKSENSNTFRESPEPRQAFARNR